MADTSQKENTLSNFIRAIIEKNLAQKLYLNKKWGGSPGDATHHAKGNILSLIHI